MTTKPQAMPYMKHYLSYLTDDDFTELDRVTRSFYWDFYLLAWNADAEGNIQNRETGEALSPERIAKRLYEADVDKVNTALAKLREAGFIELQEDTNTWRVTRYSVEQDNQTATREKWNKWQRDKRERDKNEQGKKPEGDGYKPDDTPYVINDIPMTHALTELNKQQTELKVNQHQTEPNPVADADDSLPKSKEQSREGEYTEMNPIPEVENNFEENLKTVLNKWHDEMPDTAIDTGLESAFGEAIKAGKSVEDIHGVIEYTRQKAYKNSRTGFFITCIKNKVVIPAVVKHVTVDKDGGFYA